MEPILVDRVNHYLSYYMYDNATFLCERLYAEYPSELNLHLLATCFFRSGHPNRAITILQGSTSAENRYLFALCCYRLQKLQEAETAMLHGTSIRGRGPSKCRDEILAQPCPVPNGAAGLHLLGHICKRANRRQQAIEYFSLSLQLDPFLWSSYEALCALGANLDASSFFGGGGGGGGGPSLDASTMGTPAMPTFTPAGLNTSHVHMPMSSLKAMRSLALGTPMNGNMSATSTPMPQLSFNTPMAQPHFGSTPASGAGMGVPSSAQHGNLPSSAAQAQVGSFATPSTPVSWPQQTPQQNNSSSGSGWGSTAPKAPAPPEVNAGKKGESSLGGGLLNSFKRASRLSFSSAMGSTPYSAGGKDDKAMREGSLATPSSMRKEKGNSLLSRSKSHDTKHDDAPLSAMAPPARPVSVGFGQPPAAAAAAAAAAGAGAGGEGSEEYEKGLAKVMALLCTLGKAFNFLSQYLCREALDAFHRISPAQFESAWVQQHVGKAHFEMADYTKALRAFQSMHRKEPHRLEGLDLFSTNLWHLKREIELCYLAQEVSDYEKRCPQVWCVVGNCFSLQKEHEMALKFFQRAIQIDPSFTYAYTLSGHEYVSNEDFEKAVACYRHAIRTDGRHYNAWYGLGTIYYRQEKFDLAEYHFRRALTINPRSSVLYCYLGMVLHANRKYSEALTMLAQASDMQPSNPQARFQRANVLLTLERYEEALRELTAVRDCAPRESSVHFLMGKVCKRLGRVEQAMTHFTTALDLHPKDNNMIKVAIDRLNEPDIDEEDKF